MAARIAHVLLWPLFVLLGFESVVTAASSIYWAAERDLSAALISVLMTILSGVVAFEFWRGLKRPSLVRH